MLKMENGGLVDVVSGEMKELLGPATMLCPEHAGGGDEETLQSRRLPDQGAISHFVV